MITLNQWRTKLEAAYDEDPTSGQGGNADFSWLKYLFDTGKITPPAAIMNKIGPAIEGLKDDFAEKSQPHKKGVTFRDVSAAMAKSFAVQVMAAVLKELLPEGETGGGRTLDTKSLQSYMGEEGDQFVTLKKVLGRARMVAPSDVIAKIRVPVATLRNAYAQKYGISQWNEQIPQVKTFTLHVLAAVLKSIFPDSDVSGTGRSINLKKVGDWTNRQRIEKQTQPGNNPIKAPTREPDQSMQPPEEMKV